MAYILSECGHTLNTNNISSISPAMSRNSIDKPILQEHNYTPIEADYGYLGCSPSFLREVRESHENSYIQRLCSLYSIDRYGDMSIAGLHVILDPLLKEQFRSELENYNNYNKVSRYWIVTMNNKDTFNIDTNPGDLDNV